MKTALFLKVDLRSSFPPGGGHNSAQVNLEIPRTGRERMEHLHRALFAAGAGQPAFRLCASAATLANFLAGKSPMPLPPASHGSLGATDGGAHMSNIRADGQGMALGKMSEKQG